jgi:hypothetical protein
MPDQLDNGDTRFSTSEEQQGWSWNKRPGITTNQAKKEFEPNSAEAVRQALGKRALPALREPNVHCCVIFPHPG